MEVLFKRKELILALSIVVSLGLTSLTYASLEPHSGNQNRDLMPVYSPKWEPPSLNSKSQAGYHEINEDISDLGKASLDLASEDRGVRYRAVVKLGIMASNLADGGRSAAATMALIDRGLKDEDYAVQFRAIEELFKIGYANSELDILVKASGDEDSNKSSLAKETLGRIIESSINALNDVDKNSRSFAERGLMNIANKIGDIKVIASLEEKIKTETDPVRLKYLQTALQEVSERRIEIKESLKQEFNIIIEEGKNSRFTLQQLETIHSVLASLPPELVIGLDKITTKIINPYHFYNFFIDGYDGQYFEGFTKSEKTISLNLSLINADIEDGTFPEIKGDLFTHIIIHETAHFMDAKYFDSDAAKAPILFNVGRDARAVKNFFAFWLFGSNAFKELHDGKSEYNGDFAWSYGRGNSLEDFATTVEAYFMNVKGEFGRAIKQASECKPVYLEKLLIATEFFTKGHPDYATMYDVSNSLSIKQLQVGVSRDNEGRISSIGGVSINDLDGLERFFTGLSF